MSQKMSQNPVEFAKVHSCDATILAGKLLGVVRRKRNKS